MPRCPRSTALLTTLLLATTAGCAATPFEAAYEDDLGPLPVDPQVDLNAPIPEDAVFAMDRVIVAMADTSNGLPTTLSTDATQLDQLETIDGTRAALYEVPAGEDIRSLVERLRAEEGVLYAEPDYERLALANDPYLSYQWHMDAVGAEDAWLTSTGDGAVVAILDTGVSSGPYDGIGTLGQGYDFYNRDSDASDDNGHGTHVAGTVGQATDNGAGVAGLAYDATIIPVKVLGRSGGGSTSLVVAGINFAVTNGADVINMSLGSTAYSSAEAQAVQNARNNGVFVAAASGNSGRGTVEYPGAYPGAVAVGAVGYGDVVTGYSNTGSDLDLVAPGGDLSRDANGDGYADGVLQETVTNGRWGFEFFEGTSMAAPHVAAAAALLMAEGATAEEAQALLESTARDIGSSGWDRSSGWGSIDVAAALEALDSGLPTDDGGGSSTAFCSGFSTTYSGTLTRSGDWDAQPDGTYFRTSGGRLEGCLEGPGSADFDLALYQWNGRGWESIATSTDASSEERISVSVGAGYYYWRVTSYDGAGDYQFAVDLP
jgi:serine protease